MGITLLELFLENCINGKEKICVEIENNYETLFSQSYDNVSYEIDMIDCCSDGIKFRLINKINDEVVFGLHDLNKYNITEYDGYINISDDNICVSICVV